jgi:phosphoenolpyruvate carboxylase
MTESIEHIQTAARFQKKIFNSVPLPVIPLFENAKALSTADQIVSAMVKNPEIAKSAKHQWDSMIELMVGYSDSAKEAGVLASRLAISKALLVLEKICEGAGLIPVFFHGSGGSVDRGGGSIEDQTAWWPKSALRVYKVTVQGEMVERSMASPAIASRQLESIIESVAKGFHKASALTENSAVEEFAKSVSAEYRQAITSPEFLKWVEAATPYSYLNVLKIGSRPSKRSTQLTIKALRAIPWVLCWTQTRVLFPTWWGVGTVWKNSSEAERVKLILAFKQNPIFTSYIKALGFTLAKVEMSVWKMYLQKSGLESVFSFFSSEYELTRKAYFEICAQTELMWFRPWLGESSMLRSSMIHPLNLLQILATSNKDPHLLRVTVTGISSGMLTTG